MTGNPSVGNLSTTQALVTGSWKADVETLDTAIRRWATVRPLTNACRVAFFEIRGDPQLHINVTHRDCTATPSGWAGPASVPDGFVHNRRFDHTPSAEMIGDIHDMVMAQRLPPRRSAA